MRDRLNVLDPSFQLYGGQRGAWESLFPGTRGCQARQWRDLIGYYARQVAVGFDGVRC